MNKKILLYAVLGIIILALLIFTFFSNAGYAIRDFNSDSEDKCSPPVGTSLKDWEEHMGHHPEMYKECLE